MVSFLREKTMLYLCKYILEGKMYEIICCMYELFIVRAGKKD